jgi:hypothetical protein
MRLVCVAVLISSSLAWSETRDINLKKATIHQIDYRQRLSITVGILAVGGVKMGPSYEIRY